MNILYVLHKDPDIFLGGVERHTVDLIRDLSLHNFNVYLAFTSTSAIVLRDFSKGKVEERRYKGFFCADMDLENSIVEENFRAILRNYSIDIVHFQHLLGLPLSLIEVAKQEGTRVIISVHDYFFWCPNYKLLSPLANGGLSFCFFEKDEAKCAKCLDLLGKKHISPEKVQKRREYIAKLFGMSDAIILFSKYVQDIFCALYPTSCNRTIIIEHGLKIQGTSAPIPQQGNNLNIAYLGAFTYEKGADIFIEIIRKIKNMYLADKVNFTVIGEIGYPLPDDLLRVKDLKSIGAYRPHEVGRLLKGTDLVLLLSRWPETYSYTLSEAVAHKIPVIATDLGALRERIAEYSVGYLVPYDNPIPRVIEIAEDFLAYPELLQYFRQQCAKASNALSDINKMVMEYSRLYSEMGRS
jgi:glycosyltransferase involved in cell wall biosynthesis